MPNALAAFRSASATPDDGYMCRTTLSSNLGQINQFVQQVMVSRILSHLNASPTNYLWVIGAWLRLQTEELPEQDLVGLDSHEFFAEVHEHRDMEYTIGVQVQVLNTVVLEKTFEEIAGREG
jgi:hypothetical protein